MTKFGHYKMFNGVRFTFEMESYSYAFLSGKATLIKNAGYFIRIVEGSRHGKRVYRLYKRKKPTKTKSKKDIRLGKFLLQTRTKMDELVTVYKSIRGSFYIMRNGRKVYVHEVGWGYRDSDFHKKKGYHSYQIVRIGSSRDPRWGYRQKR